MRLCKQMNFSAIYFSDIMVTLYTNSVPVTFQYLLFLRLKDGNLVFAFIHGAETFAFVLDHCSQKKRMKLNIIFR